MKHILLNNLGSKHNQVIKQVYVSVTLQKETFYQKAQ